MVNLGKYSIHGAFGPVLKLKHSEKSSDLSDSNRCLLPDQSARCQENHEKDVVEVVITWQIFLQNMTSMLLSKWIITPIYISRL